MNTKGRYSGLTRRKREEREKKKVSGVEAAIASIAGQVQKFINEWSSKFNKLSVAVDTINKLATTEIGRIWANEQRIVDSIDHMDINVLAVAELNKKIYARFARHDSMFEKLETLAQKAGFSLKDDVDVAAVAEALYSEEVKAAFTTVFDRRKAEDALRKEAMEKAAVEAKAAAEAKTEAEKAEVALREAEAPQAIEDLTAGGKGADIPEGAEVFGGV